MGEEEGSIPTAVESRSKDGEEAMSLCQVKRAESKTGQIFPNPCLTTQVHRSLNFNNKILFGSHNCNVIDNDTLNHICLSLFIFRYHTKNQYRSIQTYYRCRSSVN
jgi:hypothetical protein